MHTGTDLERIVSLVPSATETVFALGLGDRLVGRSHACDFPPAVSEIPALTRPHLREVDSRGIHDEVRARLADGLAIYDLDLDALRALAPTTLLIQDQCSVCALTPADLTAALVDWIGHPPKWVSLAPHQLADVWRDIEKVGQALGRTEEARILTRDLSHRLADIAEAVGRAPARPRVACLEWLDPLMISGHWVPELIRIAGGEPILSTTGGPSTVIEARALAESAPEIVVVAPCGFDREATIRAWNDAEALRRVVDATPGWSPEVVLCDGDRDFNRPGPRLVETAERLAAVLRPDLTGLEDVSAVRPSALVDSARPRIPWTTLAAR